MKKENTTLKQVIGWVAALFISIASSWLFFNYTESINDKKHTVQSSYQSNQINTVQEYEINSLKKSDEEQKADLKKTNDKLDNLMQIVIRIETIVKNGGCNA